MLYGCVLIITSLIVPVHSQYMCFQGFYLALDKHLCLDCPEGSFISEMLHSREQCLPCSEIKDPSSEEINTACNRTHDAVIVCKAGHSPVSGSQGGRCLGKCGPNTYYNISADDCRPCPLGYVMDKGHHSHTSCRKYQVSTTTMESPGSFCGKNQYLSVCGQCMQCPAGTFQNQTEHLERTCQECASAKGPSSLPAPCTNQPVPAIVSDTTARWPFVVAVIVCIIVLTAIRSVCGKLRTSPKCCKGRNQLMKTEIPETQRLTDLTSQKD